MMNQNTKITYFLGNFVKNNRQSGGKADRVANIKAGSDKSAVNKIMNGVTNKAESDNVSRVLMTVDIVAVMPKKKLF